MLSPSETLRYSRHLILPEVGVHGQERLKRARVLCIGAGGLGSPAAMYLAAAGVGTITLVDFDVVDITNLQRQILHGTADIGRSKLLSARDRLAAINPHVQIELHDGPLDASNALALVAAHDVVVDGTDNFPTRYLVNDACVMTGTPNAYGAIFRFEGQASVFGLPDGPCYRCLHPEPPPNDLIPNCAEAGVLGVLPGIVGTIQATEAVKLIVGMGEPLVGRFLLYDALRMRFRELRLKKDPDCPVCGRTPSITELRQYAAPVCEPIRVPELGVQELRELLAGPNPPTLIDVREPDELAICRIPGAISIPLGQLEKRVAELDPAADVVLQCRSGRRSAQATELLLGRGFSRVRNLRGGILAWIDEVDPTLPKY